MFDGALRANAQPGDLPIPRETGAGEFDPNAGEADARLAILKDLEDGRIDVATATERLAALEDGSDG